MSFWLCVTTKSDRVIEKLSSLSINVEVIPQGFRCFRLYVDTESGVKIERRSLLSTNIGGDAWKLQTVSAVCYQ